MSDELEDMEAFIASSFVDFHTEEPSSPGDWIPMTEEEARERWDAWLAEHDRQVAAAAWEEGHRSQPYRSNLNGDYLGATRNPYRPTDKRGVE